MDNFTHSLAGWVLGQAGLKTKTRKGLAALILGANLPDIDVFLGWVPWRPLATHRGFTHGIGGIILLPTLLCAALLLIDRWQVRRNVDFPSRLPMRPRWLLLLSYLGTLTHPLLDYQNSYGIQLLAPFSSHWFHGDSLFIIDLWLWLLVAGAIAWSRRRESADRPDWCQPAQLGLLVAAAYIGGNLAWSLDGKALTRQAVIARTGHAPDLIVANEEPVTFWRRSIVWRRDHQIGHADFAPGSFALSPGTMADNMTDPLVAVARRADRGIDRFLYWSIMPQAIITRDRCAARVTITDARYASSPIARRDFRHGVTVPLNAPGCPPGGRGIML